MLFPHQAQLDHLGLLLRLAGSSLEIRRQVDFFIWLQGDFQRLVPHDVAVMAWGDFTTANVRHQVFSSLSPGRPAAPRRGEVKPFLGALFQRWIAMKRRPYVIHSEHRNLFSDLPFLAGDAAAGLPCALVHGIRDRRTRNDFLYVFLGPGELKEPAARDAIRLVMPFIDMGYRQAEDIGPAIPAVKGRGGDTQLSERELEILEWVRRGKTNIEIGLILEISNFTVKNHLQRIFRKLRVANRAQAIAKFLEVNHGRS